MWRPPDITVSGGFLLLTAWFALSCGPDTALLVLSAAAFHELGHLVVLKVCGARVRCLHLSVLGAVMEVSGSMSYPRELAAVLAGPGANLLAALVLGRMGLPTVAGAHGVLCAFNLLPVRPLDGGRALYLLLCWAAGPQRAEPVCRWIGLAAASAVLWGTVWLMRRTGGSLWLLPAAGGIFSAACQIQDGRFCLSGR